MKKTERAVQIWPVLALAARNRQVLTYGLLSGFTGIAHQGLGQCLEPIQSYCLSRGLPPLTALVVLKDSGVPGDGFIAAADVPKAQQEVFSHDWLKDGCPSVEDFNAVVEQESERSEMSGKTIEDFHPIEIPGEGLSATILQDRR